MKLRKLEWPWVRRSRLIAEEQEHEMSNGCLDMIHGALEARINMDGCPPMFYPEAIRNIANLPRRAIMKATGCDEKRVAKADEAELIAIILESSASATPPEDGAKKRAPAGAPKA